MTAPQSAPGSQTLVQAHETDSTTRKGEWDLGPSSAPEQGAHKCSSSCAAVVFRHCRRIEDRPRRSLRLCVHISVHVTTCTCICKDVDMGMATQPEESHSPRCTQQSGSEVRFPTSIGEKEVGVWAGDRKVWGGKICLNLSHTGASTEVTPLWCQPKTTGASRRPLVPCEDHAGGLGLLPARR